MTVATSAAGVPVPQISRMHCHGNRPGQLERRTRGAACERFLGYVPGRITFDDVAARAPDVPDGRIWVRCPKCRTWNVFKIVPHE